MMYKVKPCFVIKEVAGDYIVFPRGNEALQFSSVLVFNETGALLWHVMENGASLACMSDKLSQQYGISLEQAASDINDLINKMDEAGLLEKYDE